MYKTKCNKCGKTYDTDVKYCNYSYVCDECIQKQKEYDSHEKERAKATLEAYRKEMEDAIASGNQAAIDFFTRIYNGYKASYESLYGSD